jgi:hypothetical protein
LDDNFPRKSSYESFDSSADDYSDEAYSPSEDDSQNETVKKRMKRRKIWDSQSAACSSMTASTASSDPSRQLSKPTATGTPQVVIYV